MDQTENELGFGPTLVLWRKAAQPRWQTVMAKAKRGADVKTNNDLPSFFEN